MNEKPHHMSAYSVWRLYTASWQIIRGQIGAVLIFLFLASLAPQVVNEVPWIGSFLGDVLLFLMSVGFVFVISNLVAGKTADLDTLFKPFFEFSLLKKVIWLAVIYGIFGALLTPLGRELNWLLRSFFLVILDLIVIIIVFDNRSTPSALQRSLKSLTANWRSALLVLAAFILGWITLVTVLISALLTLRAFSSLDVFTQTDWRIFQLLDGLELGSIALFVVIGLVSLAFVIAKYLIIAVQIGACYLWYRVALHNFDLDAFLESKSTTPAVSVRPESQP